MNGVFFLVLRRMRAPLIVLIVIYAVAVLGLTLVPGVDADGRPAPPLSFFHAFYFISYTATTIGFGEIPTAFSEAQRLWVIVCIYLTVVGWSYSILTLLALLQDRTFLHVLRSNRFARRVRHLREPFYLVCGCGETGALVCRGLDRLGLRFVVVEMDEGRVQELDLMDFRFDLLAQPGDARLPAVLQQAGLGHPWCRGLLALTNDDNANLAIAIATRLLAPDIPVVARAESPEVEANMASFGADHVINPFVRFAEHLGEAIEYPYRRRLIARLTHLPGSHMEGVLLPPSGQWVVCGYGRFARPVISQLNQHALPVTVISPEAPPSGELGYRYLQGVGTTAETLRAAGITEAVGLVAGSDNDINNLSIAMTAQELNPELFIVMRQNRIANQQLFAAFSAAETMVHSQIIAHECLAVLITPLLAEFLGVVRQQADLWAAMLDARLSALCGDSAAWVWRVDITPASAPAVVHRLGHHPVEVGGLLQHVARREDNIDALPLLLRRDGQLFPLPTFDLPLQLNDQLLFAGTQEAQALQRTPLGNLNALEYLQTGREHPAGWLWRWLEGRQDARGLEGGAREKES